MNLKLGHRFWPLMKNAARYLVLCGGAGSGKSEFAGRKIYIRCQNEGGHKFLIMRKVRATLRESCVAVMIAILEENSTPYSYNKSNRILRFKHPTGVWNTVLFEGMDKWEKIKSIKGITSVWIEEATELTKKDFEHIDLYLRGPTRYYKQIMMSFNPDEARAPWLKEMFFFDDTPKEGKGKKEDSYIHPSTIEDNPIESERIEYGRKLDSLDDPVYRRIYRLGLWAMARGIIYNWDVVDLPEGPFDEIFYGGDFGYSINPAAYLRIYRKGLEFWLQQVLYATGMTNDDIAEFIKNTEDIDPQAISYWDAAEPKSIEELFRKGLNAHPSEKGKGSVKTGIDFLKSIPIHIVKGDEARGITSSPNLIEERKSYKWKEDKNGNPLPVPVEFKNHLMDGGRYGIYTHYVRYLRARKKGKVWQRTEAREKQPVDIEQRVKESIARTRQPPEEEIVKQPLSERMGEVAEAAKFQFERFGKISVPAIIKTTEESEIVVRNTLASLGYTEGDIIGEFDRTERLSQGEQHGRRKGRVHINV